MRPMLALDYDPDKPLSFPLIGQPKIDGVRGMTLERELVTRELKPFANRFTTGRYNHPYLANYDGELYVGEPNDDDLCRKTVSATNTIEGQPNVKWMIFDIIEPRWLEKPYSERLNEIEERMYWNRTYGKMYYVDVIPWEILECWNDVISYERDVLSLGFEGIILRNPDASYKQGRGTFTKGELFRKKPYDYAEAIVIKLEEGRTNKNEQTQNAYGLARRCSKQANMIPNERVGALFCRDLITNLAIKVSAGKMTIQEREYYFTNPQEIVGRKIVYKYRKQGMKDKPREPTFQRIIE